MKNYKSCAIDVYLPEEGWGWENVKLRLTEHKELQIETEDGILYNIPYHVIDDLWECPEEEYEDDLEGYTLPDLDGND